MGTANGIVGQMKRLKTSLAGLALLIGAGLGNAKAASLSTDLTINMSSALILACFDNVDVDLSVENFIATVGRNGTRPMPDLIRTARARNGELIANGRRRTWTRGRYSFRRRVNLDLHNVCAYRAIGGVGGARVTVDALEPRLDAAGGSHIDVIRVRTRDYEDAGPWRRQFRIPPIELGHGDVRGIDVRLRLDLRDAQEPGLYSSPTDGTFMITVTPNP